MKCSIRRFIEVSVVFLLALTPFGLGSCGSFCVGGSDDASSRIAAAGDALQQSFAAVLEAQKVGANVSALLQELDAAGRNLTEAEMAYESGSLVEAASKADQCSALADTVAGEASALRGSASLDVRSAEWEVVTFSGVSAFVFLIALVLVWVVFRRFYGRKLLEMRPEAGS